MARRTLTLVSFMVALIGLLYSWLRNNSSTDHIQETTSSTPIQYVGGRNNTVLFMTNSEHGLRNAILATINSLLINHPHIEVHIAGFADLEPRLDEIVSYASRQNAKAKINFHLLPGKSYADTIFTGNRTIASLIHPPGFLGVMGFCRVVSMFFMPWKAPDYLSIHDRVREVIDQTDPAVVAVDPALFPGAQATRTSGRKYLVLSTNTIRENAPHEQGSTMLWKFPAFGTGFSYPVPWYQIPANIFLNLQVAFEILTASHVRERTTWLKDHGIKTSSPVEPLCKEAPLCITQSLVEAEYPFVIPDKYKAYGPMVVSLAKAEDQDPEIVEWMSRRPTILINLGSLFPWDVDRTKAMARALNSVTRNYDVQVLWKLKKREPFPDTVYEEILGEQVKTGKIRVVSWFKADPTALMETGHVVLAVHHGGASSFYEPLSVGIPQMVLPHWVDCYDAAVKAEYVGVGLWGSRKSAPLLDADELQNTFDRLLGDGEESRRIVGRAKEIGAICQKAPGRDVAAAHVAHLAAGRESESFKFVPLKN